MSSDLDVRPAQKESETGGLRVPHPPRRLAPGVPPWVSGGGGARPVSEGCHPAGAGLSHPVFGRKCDSFSCVAQRCLTCGEGGEDRASEQLSVLCPDHLYLCPSPTGEFRVQSIVFYNRPLGRKQIWKPVPLRQLPPSGEERIPPGHSW